MGKLKIAIGVAMLLTTTLTYADSMLRIKCADQDAGAEIFINGNPVGECTVDTSAPAGTVELLARKVVDQDHEQLFKKQIKVIDGVPQRILVVLGPTQLTTEARLRNEKAEADAQLQAAERGNIEAMRNIAALYESGKGISKDSEKANAWRHKVDEIQTAQLASAEKIAEARRQKYIDNANNRKLYCIEDRNPFSDWRAPTEHRQWLENCFASFPISSEQYGGIGIQLAQAEEYVKIVSTFNDTPASRGGLKPDDLIVKVDGISVQGFSVSDVSKLTRGKPDTSVVLGIQRGGLLISVALTRTFITWK